MKKAFAAAVAAPLLALAIPVQAQDYSIYTGPLEPPSAAERTTHVRPMFDDASAREVTIKRAHCTIDSVFPYGAKIDARLAQNYSQLKSILDRLPKATYAQRAQMSQDAYNIRLQLERANYRYDYVMAAHTVAMAASVATTASVNGHEWSDILEGPMDWVSFFLTQDAAESTKIWHGFRNLPNTPTPDSCK